MFTKKNLVVVASSLVALTFGAGCADVDADESGQSEEAAAEPEGAMLAEVQQSGVAPATINSPKPSPVTCTGDQNNGGRICCDATHCCINILGVINCSLPPPKKTQELTAYPMTTYQISR